MSQVRPADDPYEVEAPRTPQALVVKAGQPDPYAGHQPRSPEPLALTNRQEDQESVALELLGPPSSPTVEVHVGSPTAARKPEEAEAEPPLVCQLAGM